VRAEKFGIEVVKHPPDAPIPDMTKLETAFQQYEVDARCAESQLRFKKPIYIARHDPHMLARAMMDAGRQVRSLSRERALLAKAAPCAQRSRAAPPGASAG
jgi:hypothetical protein